MATDDTLQAAQELARQISTALPETPVPASEIIRLRERLAPEQLAEILAALQNDALARLDHAPRAALGCARVAHELASSDPDAHARAETALTLAIVQNRMGEFQKALGLCHFAVSEFEKRDEPGPAARGCFEAAWAHTFLGHLQDAMEYAERARQMDPSDLMQARFDWIQARVLRDQGSYPAAEQLFEKSHAVFESAGMFLDAARCTRELAHTYLRGERAEALPTAQEARGIFESANCPLDVALCDWLISLRVRETNQYVAALDVINLAREKFTELGAVFFVAYCDNEIGIVSGRLNRFEESLEATRRARDYFLSRDVPFEVSACDINLGFTLDTLNRYDEALTYYQEAGELALAEGREVRAGRIYNNMGRTYAKQGLYAKAMDFHLRALQIYSDKHLFSLVGSALVRLAIACRQLGQYRQAIDHLQRAQIIYQDKNLVIELAECEFNLADVCFALSESNNAAIHLERAREIYDQNGLESLVAVCNRLRARIVSAEGDRPRALSLLTASRAAFLKHHQIVDAALCDLTEGELCLEWNEPAAARPAFLRAQAVLSPGFPDQAWRVDSGLGNCASARGEPSVALTHYLDAVRTIARSRSSLVTEQLSNDFFSSRQSVYDNALKLALELDTPELALEVVEASKSRLFLSILQNREWKLSNDRNDPDIAQLKTREKELRYQLDALRTRARVAPPQDQKDVLRGDTQAQISLAELQELGALSQAYESVVTRLQLYSNGLVGVSSLAAFALAEFRERTTARLGRAWTALDYYLSGDDLTCIVVQPNHVSAVAKKLSAYDRSILDNYVSPEHDVREIVYNGTLRGQVVPSDGADDLRRLSSLLMPEHLDAETLIIAPHGVLHALPFHALKHGGDFLIQHHTLVYTPSLQALQFLLDKEPTNSFQALAIGLSDFGN
ncbi:MAG TPA: tetratricopeptide repeat protein, partial [Anaerolineae bacterium]